MRKTVAVDFDGTLCYYEHFEGPFKMGEPLKGAKEFLQALRDEGFRIVIFSCRPKSEQLRDAMGAHLDKNGMVYDKIFLEGHKPPAIAFVDDRAVSCVPQEDKDAFKDALLAVKKLANRKKKGKKPLTR